MALSVICPQCSKPYFLPDSSLGKKLGCKKCGAQFVLDSVYGEPPPPPRPDAPADDGTPVPIVVGRRIPEITDEQAAQMKEDQAAKGTAPDAGAVPASVPTPPAPPPAPASAVPPPLPTASAAPETSAPKEEAKTGAAAAQAGAAPTAAATVPVGTGASTGPVSPSEPPSPWGWLIGIGIAACLVAIVFIGLGKRTPEDRTASGQEKPTLKSPAAEPKKATSPEPTAPATTPEPIRKGAVTAPASDDSAEQARLEKYNAAVARMNRHAEAHEWKDAVAALDEASQVGVLMRHLPEGFETLATKRKVMESLMSKTPGPIAEPAKTETPAAATSAAKDQVEVPLPAFEGLRATAQPGAVAIECVMPEKLPYFTPVRIEVQRGSAPDRFDTLVHVFDVGATPAAAKSAEPLRKAEVATDEKAGTTARSARRQIPATPAVARNNPVDTQGTRRFDDRSVDAHATYYYRARLIARGPAPTVLKDGKEAKAVVPDHIERIRGEGDAVWYASPWSPVSKVTIPASLQLRFNFVTGEIPAASEPQVGYSVHLGVRIWDAEAGGWGEGSFEALVGQPIKGKAILRTGTANKTREFDTAWVLVGVRTATRFEVEKIKEPVLVTTTAENGETITVPALDEARKPKWVERPVARRTPIQIAILQDARTGEQLRLIKGLGYEEKLPPSVRILLEGEPEPKIE